MSGRIEQEGNRLCTAIENSQSPGDTEALKLSLSTFLQEAQTEKASPELQGRILQAITKSTGNAAEQRADSIFFQVVMGTPQAGLFSQLRGLVLGEADASSLNHLLAALGLEISSEFSDREKLELLKTASQVLPTDLEEDQVVGLLSQTVEFLEEIPAENRESTAEGFRALIDKGMDRAGRIVLFSAFQGCEKMPVGEICKLAEPFIGKHMPGVDLERVITAAKEARFSGNSISAVIEHQAYKELLIDPSNATVLYFLDRIQLTPGEPLAGLVEGVKLADGLPRGEKLPILEAVVRVPEGNRSAVCKSVKVAIENKKLTSKEISMLIGKFGEVPIQRLQQAASFLSMFLKKGFPEANINWIIEISLLPDSPEGTEESKGGDAREMGQQKAEYYIRKKIGEIAGLGEQSLVQDVRDQVYFAERCFQITGILKEMQESPFAEGRNETDAITIGAALLTFSPEEKEAIERIFSAIDLSKVKAKGIAAAICAIQDVGSERFSTALPALYSTLERYLSSSTPPALLGEVIRAAGKVADLQEPNDEQVKDIVKDHLQVVITEMIEQRKDWDQVYDIAYKIEENPEVLSLDMQHPLSTLVAKILVEEYLDETIYDIYDKLLEKRQAVVKPSVREFVVGGRRYSFHFPEFLAVAGRQEELKTYGELPLIDKNFFLHMLRQIEDKIHGDGGGEALDEVLALFPPPRDGVAERDPLYDVKTSSESSTSALVRALNKQGQENEEVEALTFAAYTLVNSLESASNDPIEGDPLTPRERRFLETIACIQECPSGQEDGLQTVYRMIKAENSQSDQRYVSPERRGILECLRPTLSSLAGLREELLIDQDFLLTLGDPEDLLLVMNQGAHQTKYLRSLLKEELGLLQDVKVDLGGAYVDKALRDRSKQKVLQMFYREYLPRVVPMLTAKINEEIAGGNMKLYNDITHYISLPSDEVFSLDEEGNPVITEKGTIALLQTLGVLQSA